MGYWFNRKKRNNVLENLKLILGRNHPAEEAKEVFSSFGRYFVEFFYPIKKRLRLTKGVKNVGLEYMKEAYQEGRGVIVITTHAGNWEIAAYLTAIQGFPIHGVFFRHPNPEIEKLFMEQRNVPGLEVISWKADVTRRCLEALRKKRVLAIAADIDFPGTGIEVELFGRKTRISRGPIVLSKRTGALIIPGGYVRDESGGTYFFKPWIDPKGLSEEELARKVASVIEKIISDYPTQWLCFEEYWIKS